MQSNTCMTVLLVGIRCNAREVSIQLLKCYIIYFWEQIKWQSIFVTGYGAPAAPVREFCTLYI